MAASGPRAKLKEHWARLSPRDRGLLVAAAAVDNGMKIAALRDLRRRPASQIRGPRWLWAVVVTLVNSVGIVPLCYFTLGRRRASR